MRHLSAKTPDVNSNGSSTPAQIAAKCLAETGNDLDRALALAGKRARGAKLRAVVVAISDALRRAPAN